MKKRIQRRWIIAVGVLVLLAAVSVAVFSRSQFNSLPHLVQESTASRDHADFPAIDTASLTIDQQKVVAILKQEYESQPPGTKYSEGVNEAWCADFVSWVFNEAGVPLKNPNTDYWRIPGTRTLRDYYEQSGTFRSAQSGYSPKIGDVMLYDNPSPFGQHVNIVIKNDHGVITTIGGNEPGGIRIVKHTTPDGAGFIGYGVFH